MAEKIVTTDCSRTKRTCPNSMTECDEKSKKMMANNIGKVKKIFFLFSYYHKRCNNIDKNKLAKIFVLDEGTIEASKLSSVPPPAASKASPSKFDSNSSIISTVRLFVRAKNVYENFVLRI